MSATTSLAASRGANSVAKRWPGLRRLRKQAGSAARVWDNVNEHRLPWLFVQVNRQKRLSCRGPQVNPSHLSWMPPRYLRTRTSNHCAVRYRNWEVPVCDYFEGLVASTRTTSKPGAQRAENQPCVGRSNLGEKVSFVKSPLHVSWDGEGPCFQPRESGRQLRTRRLILTTSFATLMSPNQAPSRTVCSWKGIRSLCWKG